MGLFMVWTTHKSKQAQAEQKQKIEQQRIDSLARAKEKKAADSVVAGTGDKNAMWSAPGISAAPEAGAARTDSLAKAPGDTASAAAAPAGAGAPAAEAVTRRTLVVETNRMTVTLDNLGAKVTTLGIPELHGKKPHQGELISPEKGGALLLTLNNQDLGKVLWRMEAPDAAVQDNRLRVKDAPATVAFRLAGPGGELVRVYTFHPDSLGFHHALKTDADVESYTLKWPSGLNETEAVNLGKGIGLNSNFFSELVIDNGVTVMREGFEGKKSFNEESGNIRWTGLRRKYVAAVLNFGQDTHHKVTATGKSPEGKPDDYPKEYELQLSGQEFEDKALDFDFDILPLSYGELKASNQNYEKIIFSGWEWFFRADVWYVGLCGLVLKLLKGFHEMIPNWGVAIILLTLLVRLVTFPLTIAQTKAGVRMAQHAPAIQKIRERNKGNNQKASLEIMEYYKKEGINPMAQVMGCFPVLLQMPIFISLFNVLGRAVELKDAPFVGWITDLSMPDVVWPALRVPFLFPLGLTILPFFMAATMWLQMKMSIKDPNQKMLVWMMPIMMFVFSCSFPSGLVLYWTVSNLFTIGQTYFYTNRLTKNAGVGAGGKPTPPGPGPGGSRPVLSQGKGPVKPKPAKT
jgi:YidC/Oxa1 family membrane protein insertase